MEGIAELQHECDGAMEVSEIDGGELLLNASVAVQMEEPAGRGMHRQFGLSANNFSEGWDDLDSIHPHQEEAGCEDCGLNGIIIILSGFEGFGCSPAPYDVDDGGGNLVEYWTDQEMEAAAFGPFTGDCVGEWYMDGMAMRPMMEWDDVKSYYSVYPSYSGGEACTEQLYSSPLWE